MAVHADPSRRMRPGCLGAVVGALLLVGGTVLWLHRTFNPPPVLVRTSFEGLRPWPAPLEVVAEHRKVGSPSVSSETAPPVERLYVLLAADGLGAREVAMAAARHLGSRGWRMEPRDAQRSGWWFTFSSSQSPRGESAYVGPLSAYLESGMWSVDDGAADDLRRLARDREEGTALVQLFADR